MGHWDAPRPIMLSQLAPPHSRGPLGALAAAPSVCLAHLTGMIRTATVSPCLRDWLERLRRLPSRSLRMSPHGSPAPQRGTRAAPWTQHQLPATILWTAVQSSWRALAPPPWELLSLGRPAVRSLRSQWFLLRRPCWDPHVAIRQPLPLGFLWAAAAAISTSIHPAPRPSPSSQLPASCTAASRPPAPKSPWPLRNASCKEGTQLHAQMSTACQWSLHGGPWIHHPLPFLLQRPPRRLGRPLPWLSTACWEPLRQRPLP